MWYKDIKASYLKSLYDIEKCLIAEWIFFLILNKLWVYLQPGAIVLLSNIGNIKYSDVMIEIENIYQTVNFQKKYLTIMGDWMGVYYKYFGKYLCVI